MEKDIRFEMRLDKPTAEKLEVLAQQNNKSQAAIVRDLIHQAAGTTVQPHQAQPQGQGKR